METPCSSEIKNLTGKKYVVFTARGNSAILAALKYVKQKGLNDILIQDQGGWITYPQYIKKLKLNQIKLTTNYGLINKITEKNAVLLINSMPGYFVLQDMDDIAIQCKNNNLFLINDVSGSIGTKQAKEGDILFGSFGRWKPLNMEEGGFIATDDKEAYNFFKEFEFDISCEKLCGKLSKLQEKLNFFNDKVKEIKEDLKDYDIIHREQKGLNVVVKYSSEKEKEKLIKYCNEKKLEFVECPKYIRVNEQAISIEVKRLV
ncbi:DegT/DnrJ/EryC1/StrS family aminotransferase [archaeon]|nr:DegT/DnrJ/EryC1/StrS family aminotransferase [archaeon]MBL7057525.1 DegT/DnrJ/EryC1/StrS family aminotransferase [Candidatus Woesearchaeota archaeon]